ACAKQNENSTVEPEKIETEDNQEIENGTDNEGEREKLTLNWFTPVKQATSNLPSPDEDFVKKAIEEKFNVELNMNYMPYGPDYNNKLNLLFASKKDTPDMFYTAGSVSLTLFQQGILA